MKYLNLVFTLVLSVLLMTGCHAVGPDFKPPEMVSPDAYRHMTDEAKAVEDLNWWELFDDPVLHELVAKALENNRDVKTALSRIEEARATYGFTRADQYPTLDLEGYAYYGNFSGTRSLTDDTSLYLNPKLSWEVDLWGRYRRASAAAKADILASEFSARAVQVSLIASVASTYYQLLDYRQRLVMSRETLASRLKSLGIIQQRFDKGIIPEIDLNQAQIQKEIAAGAIPQYERLIAKAEHSLSLLLGELPGSIPTGSTLAEQPLPPFVPSTMPSTLLKRRPDIRQSMAELHASNEKIGVAVAQRFPTLSLAAVWGTSYSEFSNVIMDGGGHNTTATILAPLFNFKKNLRRVEVAEIQTQQALLSYEETVLTAFREVEDALVEVDTYRRESEAASRKVAAAENAAQLSFERYDKGVSSYLEVLDSERTLFSAKLEYSENKQLFFNAYVNLYKALGGGWTSPEKADTAETETSAAVEAESLTE
ncbi:MAG: efflux transporter outer membrane subunit [Desulfobacterales bacterium]|nr:efflux transporter outer membrane subunit [Desulfobacterales bacterium]